MRFAKDTNTTVFVIGHVTKDGGIAGPKTLEHIVDTVLYFEGGRHARSSHSARDKNRFGSVDEIGVFRMVPSGLVPVANHPRCSSVIAAMLRGKRRLRVDGRHTPQCSEVQALAARAGFGTPQRVASGVDGRRLALLLAVLDKRGGISCAQLDVFCNIVGGMRVQEPAVDLAIVAAARVERAIARFRARAIFLVSLALVARCAP